MLFDIDIEKLNKSLTEQVNELQQKLEEKEKYIESLEELCNVLRQQVATRSQR